MDTQISNIGMLADILNTPHNRNERIPFLGTFLHRKLTKSNFKHGKIIGEAGDSMSTQFRTSGNLELRFDSNYDPKRPGLNRGYQELIGGRKQDAEFSYTFLTGGPWRFHEGGNGVASLLFPIDNDLGDAPFIWTSALGLAKPIQGPGNLLDLPLSRYDAGQIRIYTKIPDGI